MLEPAMDELLADVANGQFQVVNVSSLDAPVPYEAYSPSTLSVLSGKRC